MHKDSGRVVHRPEGWSDEQWAAWCRANGAVEISEEEYVREKRAGNAGPLQNRRAKRAAEAQARKQKRATKKRVVKAIADYNKKHGTSLRVVEEPSGE